MSSFVSERAGFIILSEESFFALCVLLTCLNCRAVLALGVAKKHTITGEKSVFRVKQSRAQGKTNLVISVNDKRAFFL